MLLHTVSQIIMRNMNDRPTSLTDNPWTGLAKTAIGTLGQQGAVGKYGNACRVEAKEKDCSEGGCENRNSVWAM